MITEIQYHSQPATKQDEWLISRRGNASGYFVEVGAHNGLRHSNTLTLEQSFGWTGLLIEANPQLYAEMVKHRPACKHVKAAIGPAAQAEKFALGDAYGGLMRYMTPQWLDGHAIHRSQIILVQTQPLAEVLFRSDCPATIDYLSLDVEGAELPILEAFFAAPGRFTIDYMTVEFLYDRKLLERIQRLLEPLFVLDEVRAWDACFIRKDL